MSPEKVASVLGGRSSLKVVPNEDALVGQMGALEINETKPVALKPATSQCSFDAIVSQAWTGKKV